MHEYQLRSHIFMVKQILGNVLFLMAKYLIHLLSIMGFCGHFWKCKHNIITKRFFHLHQSMMLMTCAWLSLSCVHIESHHPIYFFVSRCELWGEKSESQGETTPFPLQFPFVLPKWGNNEKCSPTKKYPTYKKIYIGTHLF